MEKFKAYRIFNEEGKTRSRFVEMGVDELDAGEVVIRSAYSSVNFKDALAATGAGKVIRRFPCVGGIDVAGTVAKSGDSRFREGDPVICTSYDLGVSHDGGFAEYVRVPADWVVPLPKGMTPFDAMAIGTAGYTAALGIHIMEQNDLTPASGKVVVNGATGGVASLAIDMLAARGYHVVAITGKDSEHEFLKKIGAAEVISRNKLEMGTRPLEKPLWAGAVDSLGGEPLAWLTRTMQQNGVIASIGNAASGELHTTVFPFILRGVRLLGIDSGYTAMPLRRRIWERLVGDLKPRHLHSIAHTVEFNNLPDILDKVIKAQAKGRNVIKIAG
ncbi:MAG: oxidoreductase [Betaproteobacteria bacterium]|nr:oxidoreductase [Betaproteobacteria bacterium]